MKSGVVCFIVGISAVSGFALGYIRYKEPGVASSEGKSVISTEGSTEENEKSENRSVSPASIGMMKGGQITPNRPTQTVSSLEEVRMIPSPLHQQGAFKEWLDRIPTAQFEGIFSKLDQSKDIHLVQIMFLTWGERDPETGAKFLRRVRYSGFRSLARASFYKAWAGRDRDGALAWCKSKLKGEELYGALSSIRKTHDAPQNLEAILSTNDHNTRYAALQNYFEKKAAANRTLALGEVMKMPDSHDRAQAAGLVVGQWSESDPVSTMLWLKGLEPNVFSADLKSRLEDTVFQSLTKKDLLAAKRMVFDTPPGGIRNARMDEIVTQMATDDLEGAIAYYEEIKTQNPNAIPGGLFVEWLKVDPERALSQLREQFKRAYADNLESGTSAIQGMMDTWMKRDPFAAARFTTTLPDVARPQLLARISEIMVREDGAKAAKWSQGLPEGNIRNDAMRLLGYEWARHDTTQSEQWLNQLPQDSARWEATRGVAGSTIDNDPNKALALMRSISDEAERMKVLAMVWKNWSDINKTSAEDWLKNTNLSETERAAITKKP